MKRRKKRRRPKPHPALPLPPRPAPSGCLTATIDGAARGNPGPAAYGVVFEDTRRKVVADLNGRIGTATNNVAEYSALLAALTHAREKGWRALRVRTDSELLARQIQGEYKVKSADLKPLHADAAHLIAALDYFAIESVPRRLTREADRLANAALDGRSVARDQRPVSVADEKRGKSGRGAEFIPPPRPPKLEERRRKEGHPPASRKVRKEMSGRGARHPLGGARGAPSPVAPLSRAEARDATRTQTIRATYENGVLKPLQPLDLPAGAEVELSIRSKIVK